ncbi:hypothetical protein [Amycolatopsis regifaucium]|uniref:Gram-positive cocci surface proteins LPxTG domain-containing protein n=1 Tax=Amycolatopsis regifaucium TaxID=546365 RepID=A0A154MDE6_9PSEU|nr:hypothetical protein [Amycolatopsis regifaucium]KZB82243.1 hypothetical protein AVL48_09955 [Amycolatopsis regifaucium]OKA05686.1 hypothetical protein ATP06_0221025 [Amycolatopsis regifaucium]SFG87301.1 hypothetical protein SAMN04489731_101775 [Amycolatopsis regifaucium]
MPKRSRLGQLAGLIAAGALVCAPVAQAAPFSEIPAASAGITRAAAVHAVPSQAQPGPVLDPAETDKANSQETKNKIIAGIVAAVLLGLVILGRRTRAKKKKS